MADVAGWGSAVVTFGLIQGALYLKAYWGHFGLDPFQFVAVSELALAGLAGIGMVLFLMLLAVSITLGSERAGTISSGGGKHVTAMTLDGKVQGGLSLIGRLGDSYALWGPMRKAAVLVSVGDVRRVEIVKRGVITVPATQ